MSSNAKNLPQQQQRRKKILICHSLRSAIDQRTTPLELPIFGDPFTEIALELNFAKGNQIFLLNGKSLQLLQPLDRDAENLSHIIFQVNIYSNFK